MKALAGVGLSAAAAAAGRTLGKAMRLAIASEKDLAAVSHVRWAGADKIQPGDVVDINWDEKYAVVAVRQDKTGAAIIKLIDELPEDYDIESPTKNNKGYRPARVRKKHVFKTPDRTGVRTVFSKQNRCGHVYQRRC